MGYHHSIGIIVVVALVTMGLRFLPFFLFGGKRKTPDIIGYLGKVLPYAIMAMLVIYCFKLVSFTAAPYGIPEMIAGVSVIILHLWKKNTLLSIVVGTIVYMVLIQFVFL